MIAATSLGPARVTAAAFWAMTLATMSTTAMTATKGAKGAVCFTALGKFWFRAAPSITGASTTCGMEQEHLSITSSYIHQAIIAILVPCGFFSTNCLQLMSTTLHVDKVDASLRDQQATVMCSG